MLEAGVLILLGFAVGTFGTLIGAGGGFMLVPVLLLLYPHKSAETITAISLFVVFANAASGSFAYARQKRIDLFSGGWFALATLPGAVAGVLLVGQISRRGFDALFAALLMVVGGYLALPQRQQFGRLPVSGWGVVTRTVRDRHGDTFRYRYRFWQGMLISGAVGFVSSLLGIGGGIIHVPVMVMVLHFPVHIATATSHFVLAGMAFEGTAVHVATRTLSESQGLSEAGLIAAGAVPGAQIGARVARRVRGDLIIRALAAALILVAVRLALAAALG